MLDREAGFSHGYTSKLESGAIKSPGLDVVGRIAYVLGFPVAYVLGDEQRKADDHSGTLGAKKDATLRSSNNKLHPSQAILDIQADLVIIERLDAKRLAAIASVVSDVKKQAAAEHKDAMRSQRIRTQSTRTELKEGKEHP